MHFYENNLHLLILFATFVGVFMRAAGENHVAQLEMTYGKALLNALFLAF